MSAKSWNRRRRNKRLWRAIEHVMDRPWACVRVGDIAVVGIALYDALKEHDERAL